MIIRVLMVAGNFHVFGVEWCSKMQYVDEAGRVTETFGSWLDTESSNFVKRGFSNFNWKCYTLIEFCR